ncbi:MAG TPA: lytic transglycosylase domain-containing protein [Longimicrobiales bacterium]|nr:lytic transglycosylase domain-containing protein [Longimicrobiales bacterium]
MIARLESMLRWARLSLIAVPVLLFGGWGLGHLTARAIELPANAPVRIAAAPHTPTGKLDRLNRYTSFLREDGLRTRNYITLYNDHVHPVEETLLGWGVDHRTARKVAWPLVEYSFDRGLDPATVTAIVLVESDGRPTATSFVGARGLMQVMPLHAGMWRGCGKNLYDIGSNICNGTSIFAALLRRYNGDERRALLAYNGCVRGTNTPNCEYYPERVRSLRSQIKQAWASDNGGRVTSLAAAP